MKKFIFYTIKSVQDYCCTFSWRFNAGFSSFFWTSAFAKKLFFYATLLLLVFGQAPIYGQLVGGAAVKANFGIEADAYANLLQFGSLPNQAGTDDWFNTTYPGSGKGVIDVTGAAALKTSILANNNYSFTKGQSVTTPAPGFPYPIVDGFLWIDSVYGRDTNSAQGNSDSSIFAGTADKNADNPITWSLGAGSIPQKDDIIDVMAHLRGTNPHDPSTNPGFPVDDRPFDVLWAYAAATLRSTDGSKHIDFEFFRTLVSYSPGDLVFGNTGSDGGRTAFTFNADGSVNVPGTIIVSIDYEGGGSKPEVRIRVWMDETVFNTYNNSAALRPFSVVPGTFEKGEQSGNFGYGRIVSNDPADVENIFGRVNAEDTTLGPPWGTIEGPNAAFFDHYQILQHVEIGINLTAFGLDRKGQGSGPCANVLGSLLVKTRSSAGGQSDSFTSEQKDFAGPFPFGDTVTPTVAANVNQVITCINTNATITATGIAPTGATIEWYNPSNVLIPGDNPLDPDRVVTDSGTYTVKVYAPGFTGCFAQATVVVEKNNTPPIAVAGPDFTKNCISNPDGGSIGEAAEAGFTYSWTSSPAGFTSTAANPTVNPIVTTTYTVTKTNTANGCSDTDEVTVTVNKPTVVANAGSDFTKNCLINISGGSIGEVAEAGFTYSWTSSPAGFTSTAANPTVNPSVTTTYTVTKTHTASGCSDTDEVTVTVNKPTVVAVAGPDFTKTCISNPDGGSIGEVAEAGFTYSWTSSPAGFTSTAANPTVNPSVTTTYTVTKTHTASGCSDTDEVTVTVNKPTVVANAGSDFTKNCLINISGGSIGEVAEAGFTYSWTSSPAGFTSTAANPFVNPSVTTTYTVTKTHTASGCSDTDEVTVTVNQPTVVAVAGSDFTKTCTLNPDGGSIGEVAQAGFTYSWISSPAGFTSTAANPTVNPSVTTTYTVTKTHTASGCSDTDEVTVTVNKPTIVVNAGSDFTKNCLINISGGSIGEVAEAGFTYSWTSSPAGFTSTAANPFVNPSVTTTYTVTKTQTASGCSDTDEVTVTVNQPTVVAVAGSDFTKTCISNPDGGSIGEAAQAGFTYSWTSSPAGFTSTAANPTVNPSVTTTYTVTKTHTASGCSDTDDVTVTVNKPTVVAVAGPDFTKTCISNPDGGSIGEAAQAGFTYSWTSSPAGFTSTAANPFVNPSVTTTYTVTKTHTASGCSDTDEVTVTVNKPTVVANAGSDFTKNCLINISGGSIGEVAEAGFTYSWTSSPAGFTSTAANPTVNPSVTTTYTVTKTHTASGCSDTDEVTVTVNKPTVVAVAGPDFTKTCISNPDGGSIGEVAQAGFTYSWISSPAGFTSTAANPTVNPSVTTTYTVTKTHTASGCSDTDEVTVTVNKPTIVVNAGSDFTKNCLINISGGSIGEVAEAGFTYSWTSSPAGFTSTAANPTVNPSVTTTYTVTKTQTASGCSDTDEVTVTVNQPTVVAVAGSDFTKTCISNPDGGSIGEAAQAGFTYSWTSSPAGFTSTAANPTVNPSVTTTYTVTKTHTASGCSDTDEVTVTVNKPTVVANAGSDFTKNCLINISGGSIGEVAEAGFTYSWTSSPAGFTSTAANPTANPSVTTTYTVTKTHTASGCSDTDEVTVTVNKPTVVAVAGPDFTKTCISNPDGGSIGEAAEAGFTYSWTSSPAGFTSTAANPTVNPSVTTTYTVTKTHTASGCSDTDEVTVTVNKPTVVANAGSDFTKNCLINISGGSIGEVAEAGFTYSWTSSPAGFTSTAANPFVNPSVTTTYTVTKTHTASGCSDTDEVIVTVNQPTVVAVAGPDFTKTCISNPDGGSIGEVAEAGFTYSWISSPAGFTSTAANPFVNPSVTTTYTVTKTHTASGCSDSDEVTVTVNIALPNAVAGDDVLILCGETTVLLSGTSTTQNAIYSWVASNGGNIVSGADTATPTVNAAGTYTLTVTDPINGCTASDLVLVTNQICIVEGCTLGYWKNHTDRWCSSYTPTMLFGDVFVNAPSNLANLTLLQALNLGGGGIFNLARQGVAALLNACSDEVDYPAPYSDSPQSVIDAVNAAYSSGGNAPGKLATQLDILNNSGCPLGGTPATKEGDGLGDKAGFEAYPVPFKDQLTIRYNFDYVSDVKIDVLNSQGVSILSKMDNNSYMNKEVTLNLNSYVDRSEVYVVKVTTNRGSSVKKIISSK
ncbi:T9SS type A sorting domain-containing protein [Flavobacterium sp. ZE23DGlu08]|uniref:T9SS type A sorting domain-containing protein n=1 Tax=Flavobacterium sp. ZE23DGlu08 TaxID=3059026 RepID=UPI0026602225|nr:T9SS type A sorting domain-containing protein [Flavobacterium sp. ZE23DGlu08]WKL43289.1 T9SS type A sorting domain-containing protein [Flavobacterium sp. ZE23DGlu08]